MTHAHPRAPFVRRALATAACLAAALSLTGCGDDTDAADAADTSSVVASDTASGTPSGTPSETPSDTPSDTPTSAPATSADPADPATTSTGAVAPTDGPDASGPGSPAPSPELIPYAGGESPGVQVRSTADTEKLHGAPEGFKQFIGRTAEQVVARSHCADGFVGVTVQAVRTDGYAIGGVNDCGGYLALWVVEDGQWTEAAGSQEMWDCAVLREHRAPSELVGDRCYDYDAQRERAYHQA